MRGDGGRDPIVVVALRQAGDCDRANGPCVGKADGEGAACGGVIRSGEIAVRQRDPCGGELPANPVRRLVQAAHKIDLVAARKAGLKTAFVERPLEKGPGGGADRGREDWMDVYAKDFVDLAAQFGVPA